MSWIDRINAAIVRRIHGTKLAVADARGVERDGQRLEYAELERAVAYHHPSLAGDRLTIALDFGGGRVAVVCESDEGWRTLLAALDAHPRNARPSTEWRLALLAGGEDLRIGLLT